jgi:type I restriction enzyme R subunit
LERAGWDIATQVRNKIATDGIIEREISLEEFPSADLLWRWWSTYRGLSDRQDLVTQDYYSDGSNKTPRYYQLLAINKTIEAIAKGQNRLLLVMATGTGKTFTSASRKNSKFKSNLQN